MALTNDDLLELHKKAFDDELKALHTEITATTPSAKALDAHMEVVRATFEALQNTQITIMEELAAAGKKAEYAIAIKNKGVFLRLIQNADFEYQKTLTVLNPDSDPPQNQTSQRLALPQKKLPEFGGEVREWLGFKASYDVIHLDGSLTNAEKFGYLVQCLTPNSAARKLIDAYPVNAKNYDAAYKTLEAQYGRPNMLIKVYVRDLLQLVIQNALQRGKINLMDLVPMLSSQIRNLKELGVTTDKCEDILYPVVESCLPEDVLHAWQRDAKYEEKLDPILIFLTTEVTNSMDRTLARMEFTLSGEVATNKMPRAKGNNKQKDKFAEIPAAAALLHHGGGGGDKNREKAKCCFCSKIHESQSCFKAKTKMTLEERVAVVKENRLCYKCLRPNHTAEKCRAFVVCTFCNNQHYELLCVELHKMKNPSTQQAAPGMMAARAPDSTPYQHTGYMPQHQQQWSNPNQKTGDTSSSNGMSNVTSGKKGKVSLHTFLVVMETPVGKFIVRAFIDEGCDESYVLTDIVKQCNFQKNGNKKLSHQRFGGDITPTMSYDTYSITLHNMNGNSSGTYTFNSIKRFAQQITKPQIGKWAQELSRHGITLHDQTNAPDEPHLLIGMNVAAQLWTGGFLRINPFLVVKETIFGWVLGGTQDYTGNEVMSSSHMNISTSMLVSALTPEDMWSLEALGITDEPASQTRKDLEEAAMHHFTNTVQRLPDGRYEVELPWINGHKNIINNYGQAVNRLHTLTRDLKMEGYLSAYHQIIADWEREGIIEAVPDQSSQSTGYYMPHRHVLKLSSTTTPLRPVFNASAKARGSPSLNDCVERGPNLLELIPGIMLRFRQHQFGVVSDVKKAFLQISVTEKHRDFLRFTWWADHTCTDIKLFRHKRVVFGVKSSPFLLAATLKYHVEKEAADPDFAKSLLQSLYVDNSVSSHSSMEEAHKFKQQSQALLLPAQFDLRGWEIGPTSEDKIVPVLGMAWRTKEDTISLCLDSTLQKLNGPATKRGLLSMVNSIFDLMGFVCPFTLIPKLMYQECCALELTWDEPLPKNLQDRLEKWKLQVPVLQQLQIPRWMSNGSDAQLSLHCFTDSSSYAFATCIFLRSSLNGNVKVQLLQAKCRVAPLKKKITIPRLELLGCLIGARLTQEIVSALGYEDLSKHFWSDSTTALAWIKNSKEWGRFVANRVDEIRKLSSPAQWSHVPGEKNPADLPSRGCPSSFLLEQRWWEGPSWLYEEESSWPNSTAVANEEEVHQELKKSVVSAIAIAQEDNFLQKLTRLSNFNKIVRVLALVYRFVDRTSTKKNGEACSPQLSLEEIDRAERCVHKLVQSSAFTGPDDPVLRKLCVFQDDNGLLRIKSQLLFGNDSFNLRCPIVLPHDNELVILLIRKTHYQHSHAGVQALQAILRDHYWILKSRRLIRKVVNTCVVCRRFTAKKCEAPTAPLPFDRIRNTVSFDITGVDLAGPLFLRGGEKVWIVLYTDAVYRGVHLELTRSLSTEAFVMTFRRFIARRGRPSIVYSDNGLNFVGANNLFREVDWNEVQRYASVERISWKFNPPTASWWGGFWERMVGVMKTLLRRILGKRVVEHEELQTILCDVESTVNRRPLTFVSECDGELQPLCPVNFMRDNPVSGLPEADTADANSLKRSARACQHLREELRMRFRKEYLGELQHHAGSKNITVTPGDVVLIQYDDKKRIDWPWGVVQEVYPSKRDGIVRSALVKTKDGTFYRPLQRLFLLECANAPEKAEEDLEEKEDPEVKVQQTRAGRQIKKPDRLGIK